jgi:hypothetical protein
MTRGVIEKVVARMRRNRHSSSLTVSDRDSSDAVGKIPPPYDGLSPERYSTEVKDVITRGKAITEKVIKEDEKVWF